MSGITVGMLGFACLLLMLATRVHIAMAMFITRFSPMTAIPKKKKTK